MIDQILGWLGIEVDTVDAAEASSRALTARERAEVAARLVKRLTADEAALRAQLRAVSTARTAQEAKLAAALGDLERVTP